MTSPYQDSESLSEQAEQDAGGNLPIFLLLGVALAALLAWILTVLRRPPSLRTPQPAPWEPGALPQGAPPTTERLAVTEAEASWAPAPGTAQVLTAGSVQAGRPPGKAATGPPAHSTRWPIPTKYVVGVLLFLAVVTVIYVSRSVIPTIILAALLAFIVQPIVRSFQRRLRLKRALAVGLTYLLVVIGLVLIPIILIPAVVNAVNSFVSVDYQAGLEQAEQALTSLSATVQEIPVLDMILGPILDSILQSLTAVSSAEAPEPVSYTVTLAEAGGLLATTVGGLAKVLGPVLSAITSLVFMVLISIYVSLSGDQLRAWYPKLIPPGYEAEITTLISAIGNIWSSFLRSQLVLMVFIGTVVWLGNLLLGNANALLLGVISGFLELIPNIGPAIALIPGVLMALLFGSSHLPVSNLVFALIVLAFYLLVQLFENQVVVPKIMGDAVNLPPLVVILGTFVGGATAGLLGVLLATPVIATGRDVFVYLYNKILEPPTATGPPEERPSLLEALGNLTKRIKLPSGLRLPWRRGAKKKAATEAGVAPPGGVAAADAAIVTGIGTGASLLAQAVADEPAEGA